VLERKRGRLASMAGEKTISKQFKNNKKTFCAKAQKAFQTSRTT